MSWWYVGLPTTEFAERSAENQRMLRQDYGLTADATPHCELHRAATDDALAVAAKQRWWFLAAGLALGAGLMHFRTKKAKKAKKAKKSQ
jgi:hypothetical protein